MSFLLKNTSEYIGKKGDTHWWRWTAFIEPIAPQVLDNVKYVEYQLHSSFKNPVKRVRNIKNGFAISSKGWGTFVLRARVVFKDPTINTISLKHLLEFIDGNKEHDNV